MYHIIEPVVFVIFGLSIVALVAGVIYNRRVLDESALMVAVLRAEAPTPDTPTVEAPSALSVEDAA